MSKYCIGIMGQAPMTKKAFTKVLEDHIADHEVLFVFPLTLRGGDVPPVVMYGIDYAQKNELPYELILDGTADDEAYEPYIGKAAATYRVQRVPHKMTNVLDDAREMGFEVELLLAWGGDDNGADEDYRAIERCWDPGLRHGGEQREPIPVFDLTDALEPLTEEGPDAPKAQDEEEPAEEAEEEIPTQEPAEPADAIEEEKPAARKRAPRKTAAAKNDVDPDNIPPSVPLPEQPTLTGDPERLPGPSTTIHQHGRTQRDIDLAGLELDQLRMQVNGSDPLRLEVTMVINLRPVVEALLPMVAAALGTTPQRN